MANRSPMGRPRVYSDNDNLDRATDAARWMIHRNASSKPWSRKRRPDGTTEAAWNAGLAMLRNAGVVDGYEFSSIAVEQQLKALADYVQIWKNKLQAGGRFNLVRRG